MWINIILISVFIITVGTMSIQEELGSGCPTTDRGYKYFNETRSCYKLHTEFLNWDEANARCKSEGGFLAVPNDHKEMIVIKGLYPVAIDVPHRTWWRYWDPMLLGLKNSTTGTWLSVHGENLKWEWDPLEPDHVPHQNCGAMIRSGLLDSIYCYSRSFFLCEIVVLGYEEF